jgi:hypothetical protein
MSFGKSTLGMMAMTRIAGRHLLMVDTQLLREQWIEKLTTLAPRVEVTLRHKPTRSVVTVFDRAGGERCVIDIFSYQTRARLEGPWVVGCFDEVHRLPAALAHRHAFAKTQYRIGLSATPDMRADGRGALVSKMTGALVGEDWAQQMKAGIVKQIPVKVLLCENLEHKHEVVGDLLRRHRSIVVLCEALADGRELEMHYGIPFVHSATKHKLQVVRSASSVVLSRIGDAGISLPHCEVTVDHSGLFGSRIQSLQRLGRLMLIEGKALEYALSKAIRQQMMNQLKIWAVPILLLLGVAAYFGWDYKKLGEDLAAASERAGKSQEAAQDAASAAVVAQQHAKNAESEAAAASTRANDLGYRTVTDALASYQARKEINAMYESAASQSRGAIANATNAKTEARSAMSSASGAHGRLIVLGHQLAVADKAAADLSLRSKLQTQLLNAAVLDTVFCVTKTLRNGWNCRAVSANHMLSGST